MGSSAAWQLASRGQEVILLEQQDSIYTYGSSFGEARISRAMGIKDDIFSFLQQTSVAETQKLIDFLNTQGGDHSMDQIYTTSPATYLFYDLDESDAEALANGQDICVEYFTAVGNGSERSGVDIPESATVFREYAPYTGTMNPGLMIQKLHAGIKAKHGSVLYNNKVIELSREKDLFHIQISNTRTGETYSIQSKNVIVAAGPYTGQLLQNVASEFDSLIVPKRLFLAFFKISSHAYSNLSTDEKQKIRTYYPVAEITDELFYSMIEKYDDDDIPIIKVGGHYLRTDINNLDSVWQQELTTEEINWSRDNTHRYLSLLGIQIDKAAIQFYKGYSCVYSLTKSEIPYVTNPIMNDGSADSNLVIVGGMSGVGAKGALAYALIAANILNNSHDTSSMYLKTIDALGLDKPTMSSDPIHK